ncbi:MAG TPA: 50S ribosomal protein L5 [Clostridia bacterium]|nr:50S ribosomal protein L5 [Clostridia bacterium]
MRLEERYQKEIVPKLQKTLGVKSPLAVPKVIKVVISMGVKEAKEDKKVIENVSEQLAVISGQKPKLCRARKSIAAFKLGKGQPIGFCVTLRKQRAFDFLEKLFKIVLPRVRDFGGVSPKGFDGQGNYSLGIKEQTVFSEINFSKIDKIRGLEVTVVTNAKSDQEAKVLLEELGMPFVKEEK